VSCGLADVIDKCLAADPARRYATAGALAGDLKRHLQVLPLQGVANRSPLERWRKWRRRRPHALKLIRMGLIATVAVAMAVALGWFYRDEKHKRERQDEQVQVVLRVRELHSLTGHIRMLYGTDAPAGADTRLLEAGCSALWERRHFVLDRLGSASAQSADAVRVDLLDLAILWPDLRVRRPTGDDRRPARAEALEVLDEAEQLLGPSVVLYRQRAELARALAEVRTHVAEGYEDDWTAVVVERR